MAHEPLAAFAAQLNKNLGDPKNKRGRVKIHREPRQRPNTRTADGLVVRRGSAPEKTHRRQLTSHPQQSARTETPSTHAR